MWVEGSGTDVWTVWRKYLADFAEALSMNTPALMLGLGEVLWDLFPMGKSLGGAPANFA